MSVFTERNPAIRQIIRIPPPNLSFCQWKHNRRSGE